MEKIYAVIILGIFVVGLVILVVLIFPDKEVKAIDLEKCEILNYNGEDKIDVVFFSDKKTAEKYINTLYEIKPFDSNKNKFNFYLIDYKPDCEIYEEIALLCYSKKLVEIAGSCPNDYIVVIKDEELEIRSSTYMNVISINSNSPSSVFLHEFGHAFAYFAEEYVPADISGKSVNCAKKCEKFQGKEDGCFEGCSKEDYFRSINNGVMKTLNSNIFGTYNEFILEGRISESTRASEITEPSSKSSSIIGKVTKEEKDCSKEKYFLIEAIFDNGNMKILNKEVKLGCSGEGYGGYSYEVSYKASVKKIEDELTGAFNPEFIFTDVQIKEDKIEGEIFHNKDKFYLVLPFVENVKTLIVKNQEDLVILSSSLEDIDSRACKTNPE